MLWEVVGSNNVHCEWFGSSLGQGNNNQYAVKRVPDDPHICLPDCWAFVVDGSILDERPLQFSSAGKIEAEGAFLNNDVTLDVGFGFNGTTDWGRLDTVGGTNWTTITGRTGVVGAGVWTVPDAPTPFTIRHP